MRPLHRHNDWRVDVSFREKGNLQAVASGVLLVPPSDALALVTDSAGDSLFRVVQRLPLPLAPDGSQCVEVVNKAAIRVLAWKIWTSNRVVYKIAPRQASVEIAAKKQQCACSHQQVTAQQGVTSTSSARQACVCCSHAQVSSSSSSSSSSSLQQAPRTVSFNLLSSNMLHSLSGTWQLEPLKIHHTSLPASCFSSSSSRQLHNSAGKQPLSPYSFNILASNSSSSSAGSGLPAGLCIDADGNVTATLVQYEQYAQPKGLPPGVRFVPGMSDAVRNSIGREVRQMLDKIGHAAMLEVQHGIPPQAALTIMSHQLHQAGGSFKKLLKQQMAAAAAVPVALPTLLASEVSSSTCNKPAAGEVGSDSGSWSIAAHPLMSISALDVTEAGA